MAQLRTTLGRSPFQVWVAVLRTRRERETADEHSARAAVKVTSLDLHSALQTLKFVKP